MRIEFDTPKYYCIVFNNLKRIPIVIKDVLILKTGKEIVFGYMAKDNRIHRHRFHNKEIAEYKEISKDQYNLYKTQARQLNKNKKKYSTTNASISYKGSGIH